MWADKYGERVGTEFVANFVFGAMSLLHISFLSFLDSLMLLL